MFSFRVIPKMVILITWLSVAAMGCAAPLGTPGGAVATAPPAVATAPVPTSSPQPVASPAATAIATAPPAVATAPVLTSSPQPTASPAATAIATAQSTEVRLAPARLCPPTRPTYSPLNRGDFWNREILTTPGFAYARIKYRNEIGQRFDIYVLANNSPAGRERLVKYVDEAQVCVEAVENLSLKATQIEPISAGQKKAVQAEASILLAEAQSMIQGNNIFSFLARHPSSLVIDVVVAQPDIEPSSDKPYSEKLDTLMSKLTARAATHEEVAAVVEFARTQFSKFEEVVSADKALDDKDFALWFLSQARRQALTMHFAMDPSISPIPSGATHFYRTFCVEPQSEPSAMVTLTSKRNTVHLALAEEGGAIQGPFAVTVPQSIAASLISNASGIFLSTVMGGELDGQYTISEGWIEQGTCW